MTREDTRIVPMIGLAVLLFSLGCAGTMAPLDLVPDPIQGAKKHNVAVHVSSDLGEQAFQEAVALALGQSGVLQVVPEKEARLHLFIMGDTPMLGSMSLTTAMNLSWILIDNETDNLILWENVVTGSKATLSDAVVGRTRLRIARERAMKLNIERGIQKLAAIDIESLLAAPEQESASDALARALGEGEDVASSEETSDTHQEAIVDTLEGGAELNPADKAETLLQDRLIEYYRKKAEQTPNDARANYDLGLALSSEKLNNRALLDRLVDLVQGEVSSEKKSVLESWRSYVKTRDYTEEAIKSFRKAVSLDSGLVEAYLQLAGALAKKDDHRGAIEVYERLIEREPEVAFYHTQLGVELMAVNNEKDALSEFKAAVQLDPKSVFPRHGMANCYLSMDEEEDALSVLRAALEIEPENAKLLTTIGWTLIRLNDSNGAEENLRIALGFDSERAFSHYLLGKICLARGDFGEAIAEYMTAAELDPDSLYILALLEALGKTERPTPGGLTIQG